MTRPATIRYLDHSVTMAFTKANKDLEQLQLLVSSMLPLESKFHGMQFPEVLMRGVFQKIHRLRPANCIIRESAFSTVQITGSVDLDSVEHRGFTNESGFCLDADSRHIFN
ncbi:hypothetical protein TNCV_3038391 [Trichonephila clavipes]|nr:hypothetical protein TNCV_3038391 [Trichonephila clavipes]